MMANILTGLTLILTLGWFASSLLLRSACYSSFMSSAFAQITQSLHQKQKNSAKWVCKRRVSFTKRGNWRAATRAKTRITIQLNGSMTHGE